MTNQPSDIEGSGTESIFNKAFPEVLLAYIADVGCEFSNSRCNELSKFVSNLELEISELKSENARLREALEKYADQEKWGYASLHDKCRDYFMCGGNGWEDAKNALKGGEG